MSAGVVALALALIELCFLVGVVVLSVRAWRKLAPTFAPLLSMLAPPVDDDDEPEAPREQ